MDLKRAILTQLGRDDLKQIAADLEIDHADRRSVTVLRKAVSRARRATPAVLIDYLGERQVKALCESIGLASVGRRSQLLERLQAAAPLVFSSERASATVTPASATSSPNPRMARAKKKATPAQAEGYRHPEATSLLRPDVGTQPQFKK
jgi:hypothetical protein